MALEDLFEYCKGETGHGKDKLLSFDAFERYCRLTGVSFASPLPEDQQSDYEAGLVVIDGESWRIRTARVTPTKPGAFVALWHRDSSGETCPFEADENVAGVHVFVVDGERFGVFSFDTQHLLELGVLRSPKTKGKRGFRVYPNWSSNLNQQAAKTQRAQSKAFAEIPAKLA